MLNGDVEMAGKKIQEKKEKLKDKNQANEVPEIIEEGEVIEYEGADIIETPVPIDEEAIPIQTKPVDRLSWKPKTRIGKLIQDGIITNIDTLLDSGLPINEVEIVDLLMPNCTSELLMVGQSKGKFGGGKRRIFKQTQKKTAEGNKPHFSTAAVIGDGKGHIGLGYGKSKETVPAREKALRNAKKRLIKVRRGCGSWQCFCGEPHSIPFKTSAKCGSVSIVLMPAPKGTGLMIQKECQKILKLAGIEDVWSQSRGQTRSTINLVEACYKAVKKLSEIKVPTEIGKTLGMISGDEAKHETSIQDESQ